MAGVLELVPGDLPSAEAFRTAVVEPCQPVVVLGLTRGWPVTRAAAESADAAFRYLKSMDRGQNAEAFVGAASIEGRYFYGEELAGLNLEREPCL